MDRFKFRVWDEGMFEDSKPHYEYASVYTGLVLKMATGHHPIEQCTGLKDKNGNLIYEGDIIRFCLNTRGYVLAYERAVVWDNESASFMIVSNLDQVKPRTKRQMPNIKTHNIEIIGNIHEQKDNK